MNASGAATKGSHLTLRAPKALVLAHYMIRAAYDRWEAATLDLLSLTIHRHALPVLLGPESYHLCG